MPEEETPTPPDAVERPERFAWRKRLREHPRYRQPYRIAVGIVGALIIIAGVITGPMPGPGGIPIVLFGLAVLASEFHWAHRLYLTAKKVVDYYFTWPMKKRRIFWSIVALLILLTWWLGLIIVGVPRWVPRPIHQALQWLPGVR